MGGAYAITSEFYHVPLPVLISRRHSQDSTEKDNEHQIIWKMIPKSPNTHSAPLSISGYLLSVGGVETSIYLYQPDTDEKWVKVGDLPTQQRHCTCAVMREKEIIVAGGGTTIDTYTAS